MLVFGGIGTGAVATRIVHWSRLRLHRTATHGVQGFLASSSPSSSSSSSDVTLYVEPSTSGQDRPRWRTGSHSPSCRYVWSRKLISLRAGSGLSRETFLSRNRSKEEGAELERVALVKWARWRGTSL